MTQESDDAYIKYVIVVCFAGCGDEFKNAEPSNAEDFAAYVTSETTDASFDGFAMTYQVGKAKLDFAIAVVGDETDMASLQVKLIMKSPEMEDMPATDISMYVKDGYAYIQSGETKLKEQFTEEYEGEYAEMIDMFATYSEFVENILSEFTDENATFKKVESGNTVKYQITPVTEEGEEEVSGSIKVVFKDNKISELSSVVTMQGITTKVSIKAIESVNFGNVNFNSFKTIEELA